MRTWLASIFESGRLPYPVLAGLVVWFFFLVSLSNENAHHPWGDDWAQYVMHARNILSGSAYADTGYLFNPDYPNVGPPAYPPGLPFLLAPILAVFGINILALKITCLIVAVFALLVTFRVLSAVFDQKVALISIFLLTLHPYIWMLGQTIGSESPYLLFNMLVLMWALRPVPRTALAAVGFGTLLGLFIFFSVSIRSIGITLLPAVLLHGWSQRKPWAWLLATTATFLSLIALQTHFLVQPTVYENELRMPTANLLLSNAYGYLEALSRWTALPAGLGIIPATTTVILSAIGARGLYESLQPAAKVDSTGVRAFVGRVPLPLWYLAFYMSALWVAAIEPHPRYLVPVMPIIISLAISGTAHIFRHKRPEWLLPAIVAALSIHSIALHFRPSNEFEMATCEPCMEMFHFMQINTSPSSIVMFAKPRAMALLGNRYSWRPADHYTVEDLQLNMSKTGVNIVVTGIPGSRFAELYPMQKAQDIFIHRQQTSVLFRNSMFQVIQLHSNTETR
jgi:hypothetical protein